MDAGKSEPTAVTTGYGTAPVATATAVPTANATATATATATADGCVQPVFGFALLLLYDSLSFVDVGRTGLWTKRTA